MCGSCSWGNERRVNTSWFLFYSGFSVTTRTLYAEPSPNAGERREWFARSTCSLGNPKPPRVPGDKICHGRFCSLKPLTCLQRNTRPARVTIQYFLPQEPFCLLRLAISQDMCALACPLLVLRYLHFIYE